MSWNHMKSNLNVVIWLLMILIWSFNMFQPLSSGPSNLAGTRSKYLQMTNAGFDNYFAWIFSILYIIFMQITRWPYSWHFRSSSSLDIETLGPVKLRRFLLPGMAVLRAPQSDEEPWQIRGFCWQPGLLLSDGLCRHLPTTRSVLSQLQYLRTQARHQFWWHQWLRTSFHWRTPNRQGAKDLEGACRSVGLLPLCGELQMGLDHCALASMVRRTFARQQSLWRLGRPE